MMIPPLLKLEFTQGPRAGDFMEFNPGSTVRIGRILCGNEIAVKDAGISTKHLCIVSDSENWIIHDLRSSSGTILNSDTLDPDIPVNLRHGDIVSLGKYTSLVVKFVTSVETQKRKLPPRPRRNNKHLAVSDPNPIEPVQNKPTLKGRSSKQDEHELPKRTRASRQRNLKDVADKEKKLEVSENWINSRVGRSRKQKNGEVTKKDEVTEEERWKCGARKSKKNTESVQKMGMDAVKLEVEDTPKEVEISHRKRATGRKQTGKACFGVENIKSDDTVLEEKDEKRTSRVTRSKKTQIGGNSFLELEIVPNHARKICSKRKKMEVEPSKSVVDKEARNDDAGEEALKSNYVEEDKRNGCVVEKAEEVSSNKNVEKIEVVDLGKMTLGEWFDYIEVQLPKQTLRRQRR